MDEITIAGQTHKIINLPGRPPVMLDKSVADLYEVSTKRVNEARSRNADKFPPEFAFQLTPVELSEAVANCDLAWNGGYTPWVFTWEGCNMLATILKSSIATQRAIQIIRGFTTVEKQVQQEPILPSRDLASDILMDWTRAAEILKVPIHIAQIEAVKATKQATGVDFGQLLLAAPDQDNIKKNDRMLEPSDIGTALGVEGSKQRRGRAVNKLLEAANWQEHTNGEWVALGKAKEHCNAHAWQSNGKSGYNLKWNLEAVRGLRGL